MTTRDRAEAQLEKSQSRKKKIRKKLVLTGAVIGMTLFFSGCSFRQTKTREYKETQFFAMDTIMQIKVLGEEKILQGAQKAVEEIDSKFSAVNSSSEVYQINNRTQNTISVSDDMNTVLSKTLEIANHTNGALNPALYPISCLWGFGSHVQDGTEPDTEQNRVPLPEEIQAILSLTDWKQISLDGDRLTLPDSMQLDFGATAKGYASGKAADYLKENGVESAYLSLGGNICTIGTKQDGAKWNIGIQNPEGNGRIGVIKSQDETIITSGNYQRYFEADGKRYHHIIDGQTGAPAESGLISVTVICNDGLTGDALSTALFVMGLDRGIQYWRDYGGFEAIFVTEDKVQHYTKGLESRYKPSGQAEVIE